MIHSTAQAHRQQQPAQPRVEKHQSLRGIYQDHQLELALEMCAGAQGPIPQELDTQEALFSLAATIPVMPFSDLCQPDLD
jgi:hypothetical protein